MWQSAGSVQEGMDQVMKAHHLRVQRAVGFVKPFQGVPEIGISATIVTD